jgi:hypothetical protein
MRRRYVVMGLSVTLALALAIPALGGPSNPVASSAASAKQIALKAKQKANQANSAAQAAQTTANQALSAAQAAQSSANTAQTTANTANANASTSGAAELGREFDTSASANNPDDNKSTGLGCPGDKVNIAGGGLVNTSAVTDDVALIGSSPFIYNTWIALAREMNAVGTNWSVSATIICINP